MGEESLEAEARGFNYLHLLAFSHRNDAEEISIRNKPPDGAAPKKTDKKDRVRGSSYLAEDRKTRKKER